MNKHDISNDTILRLAAQLDREETTKFLAGTLRALLADREWLRGERDAAHETLRDALANVPGWVTAAYRHFKKGAP